MSDLTVFADHARRMSTARHKPDCPAPAPPGTWRVGACLGCVTDADRALWVRLADEVDAYLARPADEGKPRAPRTVQETLL